MRFVYAHRAQSVRDKYLCMRRYKYEVYKKSFFNCRGTPFSWYISTQFYGPKNGTMKNIFCPISKSCS